MSLPRVALGTGILLGLITQLADPDTVEGQWIESPGSGWVSSTLYYLDTRERYGLDAEKREFFAEGHAVTTSVFVTAAVGLVSGVDAWVLVPVHNLQFDDISGERNKTGIGDVKAWLRVAPLSYFGSDFPLAIRGGVKLPYGDFPVEAEVIPLGEGQRDWELIAEVGHSLYPKSVYALVWLGYRWREINEEIGRDFGDEVFFLAQVGGQVGNVSYKVMAEGWDGDTPIIEGIPTANGRREYLQVMPSLSYPVGPGQFEVGVRIPLKGRNLPSGNALVLGYFVNWSL
jgi:hypothetical protein